MKLNYNIIIEQVYSCSRIQRIMNLRGISTILLKPTSLSYDKSNVVNKNLFKGWNQPKKTTYINILFVFRFATNEL